MHNDELRASIAHKLDAFNVHHLSAASEFTRAAVAITVSAQHNGNACIYLTLRSDKLRKHAGQFALPGGKLDKNESVETAAIRELSEELGVELNHSSVLGRLDDYQTKSGFLITPVVLWNSLTTATTPNPDEVSRSYEIPLQDLLDPQLVTNEYSIANPVFSISPATVGTSIYCPTAAIIYQFTEVALRGNHTRVNHYEQPAFAWR